MVLPPPGDPVLFALRHPASGEIAERPALVVSADEEGLLTLCVFLDASSDAPMLTAAERAGVLPRPCVSRSRVARSETGRPEAGRWRPRPRRA